MRLLLLFSVASIAFAAEQWRDYFEKDPFDENTSFDAIHEKEAYIAFKLKNEQLENRVRQVQSKAVNDGTNVRERQGVGKLIQALVIPSLLELRITGFYYDVYEHRQRIDQALEKAAKALCNSFPRYLTFDRFILVDGMIRGHLQDSAIDEQPIKQILGKYGFTYRSDSDISMGINSGFVAVKHVKNWSPLKKALNILLQKPLRASVYVDTLYTCIENSKGTCAELASVKIEKCAKPTIEL